MIRLETRKCNTILTEKQQKISALSSGKIEQYEYLAGEEIQPSDQRRVIQQANFTYFPLGKAFQQQTKKRQWRSNNKTCWNFKNFKSRKSLKDLKPGEHQELKSIQGLFQKKWELMNFKMK